MILCILFLMECTCPSQNLISGIHASETKNNIISIIIDHLTNVLRILHVGKNVRVKLEKKFIISWNFGT
jgi:hypothetical protein